MISVSLEIVIRLFFRSFAPLNIKLSLYIMEAGKDGEPYERKEDSHICG